MFGGFGVGELLVIVLLLVLLFGAKRIPEIARGLGRGISNFKSGIREQDRIEDDTTEREENHEGR